MNIDDDDRSRLANLKRQIDDDARRNIYAVFDRKGTMVVLVVATCAEDALDLCEEIEGCEDWTLANTTTRRVMRGVAGEPEVITGYALVAASSGDLRIHKPSANERTAKRRERRKRKRERDRAGGKIVRHHTSVEELIAAQSSDKDST